MKLNVRISLVARGVSFAGVDLVAMAFGHLQKQGSLMVADELKLGFVEESVEKQRVFTDIALWGTLAREVPLGKAAGILVLLVVRRVQVDNGAFGFGRDAIIRVLPQRRELRAEVVGR